MAFGKSVHTVLKKKSHLHRAVRKEATTHHTFTPERSNKPVNRVTRYCTEYQNHRLLLVESLPSLVSFSSPPTPTPTPSGISVCKEGPILGSGTAIILSLCYSGLAVVLVRRSRCRFLPVRPLFWASFRLFLLLGGLIRPSQAPSLRFVVRFPDHFTSFANAVPRGPKITPMDFPPISAFFFGW